MKKKKKRKNCFHFVIILSEFVSLRMRVESDHKLPKLLTYVTRPDRISLCIISVALRLTMNDCNYLLCNNQRHGYWLGEDNNVLFGHRAIMQDNGGVNINVKTDSGMSKLFARRLALKSEVSQIVKGWHVSCFAFLCTRCGMVENSFLATIELNFFITYNPKGWICADWYENLTWTYQYILQKVAALKD